MAITIRTASVLGGGASVPDATTTTKGKVRLATIAEAAGTSELIAVTPAGLQSAIGGIVGGMEFKGAYDIGIGVPDLTTGSTKAGDFYVVTNVKLNPSDTNTTKELYGQEWAVGDHLVVTRDIASGETDYNDAISKIDNSESISVLTDLLDVAISAEADGQVLVYDGTGEEWVNRELTVADVLNAVTQADHDALDARVTTNEGDISSIDGRLTTAEGKINALQIEQATIESHVGLNSNGSYTPDPTATYISTAATLKQADSLLDDQVKANADAISAAQTVSSNIQSELNATQSGAGLTSGGAYIVDGDANYIASATNLADADTLLDAKLKETRDLVDNLGANSVASVNGVSPVSGDVTVGGADIDTAHTATNYTASTADLDAHLSGVDTELGALQTQITSNDGDISALDGRVTTNEGDITALDGRLTTAEGELDDLEIELDATQQGAGLETNGAYVANVSTNYLGTATSLKGADEALDAKLKETRDLVDNLGANSVASVNGVSPVAGDVTVGGADIETAHTASDYTAATADIDSHLAGIDTRLSEKANSADLADIATSGAASDASVTATPTEYSAATADVEAHLAGIDTRLADKANSADLATIATSGAASDASVTATPTNYTSATADVEAHLVGIDTKLGTLETATVNNIAAVDGNITLGGADIDTAHTAVNYTAAAADLDAHLAGLDTELGLKANSADLADIATSGLASDADVGQTGPLDPGKYVSAGASVLDHLTGIAQFMATVNGEALIQEIKENFVVDAITRFDSANSLIYYTSPSNETAFTIALPDMANETITEVNKLAPHIYFYNRGQADLTFTIVTTEANVNGIDLLTYFHALNDFDHTTTGLGAGVTSFVVPKQTGVALHRKITFDSGVTERVDYLFLSVESLSSLGDVDLTGVADGDALVYDATSSKFVVSPLGTTSVSSVNGVSPVSGNVTLGGADIDTAHTAVGYTAAAADLDSHLAGIDTSLQGKSLVSAAIITGAGLEEDGSYLANGATNYLDTATSLKDADEALDAELALKANIASPALTGTPTAPTAAQGTNTTQIATTAYVKTELASLSTTAQGAEGVVQTSDGAGNFVASQWKVPSANGHLTPSASSTYDLGTASARARDLFADAVKLGSASLAISVDGTSGRLISGGGGTALTADSAEVVLASDLATVATSGDYGDLSNAPTSFINSAEFITDADPLNIVAGKHYIMGTATGSTKTLTLPSVTANGQYIRVTNWGLGELVVQVDPADADAHLLVGQNIVNGGSVTIESKATVDLFGFNYSQGGTDYSPAWGVYFSSSIELNTKSFNTTGQLPYYDATAQELKAGDLGNLTFSFAPSNYDNTRGGTVTGDAVGDHFGGVDDALGLKANSADLADIATSGASADASVTLTATEYTAATQDVEAHLTGINTRLVDLVDTINGETVGVGTHEITLGGEHIDTAHTASDYTAAAADLDSHLAGIDTRLSEKVNAADGLNGLDDVDLTVAPTDGQILLFDGVSSTFKPGPPPAPIADTDTLGLVELATDTEAQAATATDRVVTPSNLATLPLSTFDDVAYPSAPTDKQVLQWVNANSRWEPKTFAPAPPKVTSNAPGSTYSITTHEGIEEIYLLTPSVDCTVTIPTAASAGSGYKFSIKNMSTNVLTISATIDGVSGFDLIDQNSALTIISDGSNWYIV